MEKRVLKRVIKEWRMAMGEEEYSWSIEECVRVEAVVRGEWSG